MSTLTQTPGQVPLPSSALAVSPALPGLRRVARALWKALERVGQRRAARDLRDLAQRWEHIDPTLAQALRDASRHNTSN